MSTRLVSVVIDSAAPSTLARWWGRALDWAVSYENADETDVAAPAGEPGIELVFVPVSDQKIGKNRLHLDLRTESGGEQAALVSRLVDSGARRIDIGQRPDSPWVTLADPEGNEFCVLEPRPIYADSGAIAAIVLDCTDPAALAPFWIAASGWSVRLEDSSGIALQAPAGDGPLLELLASTDQKQAKDRWHLDVAPYAGGDPKADQEAERRRLTDLGARLVDIGQAANATWIVLSDPDDHEFCILSAR
ncbi:MAG TPA: VOC family protein [Mycobacteriales bacterium]|nr:VOC family protein [Mycobacteriales bacterium]